MAKNLMIQGTMSGVGKSILTAGILRVLHQDGFRVAPFKSQNMALNSFVTKDGREMGRAQALQAVAACMEPSCDMNPILIKPMGATDSQVIVNGVPVGNLKSKTYFQKKKQLMPDIQAAYERLSKCVDIVVIEGAGSPVEINLRENDIVNMGLAELLDAPVMLVGDIDPGGVFAQLLGTYQLFSSAEKSRVKAFIINKFRGDESLLTPGLAMFGEYCDVPFAGIVPYMDLALDEEDSVSARFQKTRVRKDADIRITVIRLPLISNYTDFAVLEDIEDVSLSYVSEAGELSDADLVILPGTKNTLADLSWLRQKKIANAITRLAKKGVPVIGICGGFQMLGRQIGDPQGIEGGGESEGLNLLPVDTGFCEEKTLRQVVTDTGALGGIYEPLSHLRVTGYEIHNGRTAGDAQIYSVGSVLGTYIHGIFDTPEFTEKLLQILYDKKGIDKPAPTIEAASVRRERELNRLADVLRQSLDWELIYRIIGINR